ncbi:MAG: hypothetical protein Q8R15_02865 [Candidatus Micrarchaeota archaeon]|nr:hypothetical protein [Candidatus Micrarchaeota archaeon]
MNKQTFKGGEFLGVLSYRELPQPLLNKALTVRRVRMFSNASIIYATQLPVIGAVLHFTGVPKMFEIVTGGKVPSWSIPLIFGTGVLYHGLDALDRAEQVRHSMKQLSDEIDLHSSHNENIKRFIKQGATHVFVDRQANIHFVKAPEQLLGTSFRPIVGRMRSPISRAAILE